MQWLIVLMMVNGEPAIVTGWEPIQVQADRCQQVADRTSKYITLHIERENAVVCADTRDQAAIDKALSQFGTGL